MTLKSGSRVAFVGASGCGKSTLSRLISGLYKPWSGDILFDGKPIGEIPRGVFTGSVSVVDQDIFLFEDTIANNIRMWDESIADFEIFMAARAAQIHDDILQRPGGYQGKLNENGDDLSGGQRQRLEIAREALEENLKFYRCKAAEVPDVIRNADEQMEYLLRPFGIMTRTVTREEGWYNDAFGPMMGFLKEGGAPASLLPHPLHGYWFKDPATGRHVRLRRKTAGLFDTEAICFYKPLPQKKLGIPDLLLYMKNCLSSNDYTLIALATLAVTLVNMLVTQASKAITGPVLKSGSTPMLVGMAVFLLSAAFSAELLGVVRNLMMSRINTKTSLQVEAAVMTRVLSLPVSFFRKYASGDLASRVGSVNSLCEMLVSQIMSTGLTSLISLLYISQIFAFAPLLVWPSIVIILTTAILGAVFSLMQVKLSEQKMKLAAQEAGMTYATVSGIQRIRLSGAEKRAFARWANLYARNAEMTYNPAHNPEDEPGFFVRHLPCGQHRAVLYGRKKRCG